MADGGADTNALEAAEFAAEVTVWLAFDEIDPAPAAWAAELDA